MKIKFIVPELKKIGLNFDMPPIGLLQLAALTPKEFEVSFINETIEPINFFEPVDLVAITAITPTAHRAYQIANEFKKNGVKVVLGGMHPSAMPEEALKYADAVVIGEAENIWPILIKDFKNGNLKKIYKAITFPDISELPHPRHDLIKHKKGFFNNHFFKWMSNNTIQTTRGCPQGCEFCMVTPYFGPKLRQRPIDDVLSEIYKLDRNKYYFIIDDDIYASPKYFKELLKKLIPLKIRWFGNCSLKAANDEEMLELISESGNLFLLFGFESLNQTILNGIHKSQNKSIEYIKLINNLHKYKIGIIGSFVFGFEKDDLNVFENTVKFLKENKIQLGGFHILTPWPGTKIWEKMRQENRILSTNWNEYEGWNVVFQPNNMSCEELKNGTHWAWKSFYSPTSIYNRLMNSNTKIKDLPFFLSVNLYALIQSRRFT